jgi:acetyl esterase/lipase
MNRAQMLFSAIDTLGYSIMNPKHLRGITRIRNVAYGDDPAQSCDLYYSEAKSYNKPVLINIHGGGFMRGDKNSRRYICELFADKGWFVINANYRTCPRVQLVDEINDIWAVLGQISKLKIEYGIDDSKIVLTGDSAGAYLAAYMIAISTNDDLREQLKLPKLDVKLTGLITFCGVYDFDIAIENHNQHITGFLKVMAESLSGMKLEKIEDIRKYEYYDLINIPKFINDKWCPVCMCYAEQDLLTRGQGEMFRLRLEEKQIPLRVHSTNKFLNNHCYHFLFATQASKEALNMAFEFLDEIKNRR